MKVEVSLLGREGDGRHRSRSVTHMYFQKLLLRLADLVANGFGNEHGIQESLKFLQFQLPILFQKQLLEQFLTTIFRISLKDVTNILDLRLQFRKAAGIHINKG